MLWSKKSAPAIPPMNISGMKTLQVVSTELSMGAKTLAVPLHTAFSSFAPPLCFCKILSITIIELSTIIPTPKISPEREMILMDMPANLKQSKVITRDTGIDNATSKANLHLRKKRTSTIAVKKMAAKRFHSRLWME